MIYVLFILLVIILFIVFKMSKRDIIFPSFIFTLSFTLSCAWAVLFAKRWGLTQMNPITIVLIVGAVLEYVLIALIVKLGFKKYSKSDNENTFEMKSIKIDNLIKYACLLFEIIVIIADIKFILDVTKFPLINLKDAISKYDYLYKLSDLIIKPPRIIGISLIILHDMGYWFLYVAINNYVAEKEIDWRSLGITICSIILSIINGSRTPAICMVLAGVAIFYILNKKKIGYKNSLNIKRSVVIKLIIVFAIFLITFPQAARLMGRNITENTFYYLGIYCGAEIKNFDMFIDEYCNPSTNSKYIENSNNQTFINFVNWWGSKIGLIDHEYKLDLPFRTYDDNSLGNVYTTLYPYVYDYGLFGIIPCVAFMAFVCQFVYSKAKESKLNNKVNIWILSYGYIFNTVCLAFFSNKFYEQVFNKGFLFGLVFWFMANYLFNRATIIIESIRRRKDEI